MIGLHTNADFTFANSINISEEFAIRVHQFYCTQLMRARRSGEIRKFDYFNQGYTRNSCSDEFFKQFTDRDQININLAMWFFVDFISQILV